MEIELPKANLFPPALKGAISTVEEIIRKEGGKIKLTDLLTIINFPTEVNLRIKKARGDVDVECKKDVCTATNSGDKINEGIPGTNGFANLVVEKNFSCSFILSGSKEEETRKLEINSIEGLEIDIPGPFNPDVTRIIIKEPNYVKLEIGG